MATFEIFFPFSMFMYVENSTSSYGVKWLYAALGRSVTYVSLCAQLVPSYTQGQPLNHHHPTPLDT